MSERELRFLFRDVMHKGHQTLTECKLDDKLAHLFVTDYDAYKDAVVNHANGNALVHV